MAHRTGLLEVHAYSVLTTHYHLLVRSPSGQMAVAMQRVGNRYVRWFNRRARRDGPLFRGERPVDWMIAGGLPAVMAVRDYVDALRGGV